MRLLPILGQEHGAAQEAADGGHSEVFDLGEMLSHHILNHDYYEFPGFVWYLPHWEPLHIGA